MNNKQFIVFYNATVKKIHAQVIQSIVKEIPKAFNNKHSVNTDSPFASFVVSMIMMVNFGMKSH